MFTIEFCSEGNFKTITYCGSGKQNFRLKEDNIIEDNIIEDNITKTTIDA